MWADVNSESADSSRKPMNDGQITWRWSIMLRPKSCRPHSPSMHRQNWTAHPCYSSLTTLPPSKPFPTHIKQRYSSASMASVCGGEAESGGGSCTGKLGEAGGRGRGLPDCMLNHVILVCKGLSFTPNMLNTDPANPSGFDFAPSCMLIFFRWMKDHIIFNCD